MKKTYIIFIAIIALLVLGYVAFITIGTPVEQQSGPASYKNEALGLTFAYRAGPNGYVVEESTPADTTQPLVRSIVLIRSEDAAKGMPAGGEGPATITVSVYKNEKKQWPQTWADENPQYSNINLKQGAVSEAVVGGANAIRYMADGLYASENVVVAHGEYIYVLSGMFMDENSTLRKDFAPLVESVAFIPTPTTQAKINIDAVCQGALAYMTFPDAASAEVFVAECKEGKHPEVIEQYKAQMNLGDGATI